MARQYLPLFMILVLGLYESCCASPCPCSNSSDCQPIVHDNNKEVYGIILDSTQEEWNKYHFDKLTTLVMLDFFDPQLVCFAHSHNVRVIVRESISLSLLENQTLAAEWIEKKVKFGVDNYLDGIDLWVDGAVDKDAPQVAQLNEFVKALVTAFKTKLPHSIVVFDVPFSPYNQKQLPVDGKAYDYATLWSLVDQVLVVNYDQRRQSYDQPCLAGSPSNYFYTVGGLLAYSKLSVNMSKAVIVLPAFAHDYACANYGQNLRCYIDSFEFRGANCSSQVADVVPYTKLEALIEDNKSAKFFDEHSSTQMAEYFDVGYGYVHQVFYDSVDSFRLKAQFADQNGARGVGVHAINWMNNLTWSALPDLKDKPL